MKSDEFPSSKYEYGARDETSRTFIAVPGLPRSHQHAKFGIQDGFRDDGPALDLRLLDRETVPFDRSATQQTGQYSTRQAR